MAALENYWETCGPAALNAEVEESAEAFFRGGSRCSACVELSGVARRTCAAMRRGESEVVSLVAVVVRRGGNRQLLKIA